MTLSPTLYTNTPTGSTRRSDSEDIRLRALERLYERKAAVNGLIASLEEYQRFQRSRVASPASVLLRKCS
jgi:hypothetical protein